MILRWLGRLEESLIAFLLAVMTLITFCQVIARYFFNYSFAWALELTTFLFGGLIFIGMSYGVRVGAHVGIDVIVRRLGGRAARNVAIVATLLCLLYAGIVLVGGWIYVNKMYEIGILAQDLPVPQWIPRLVLPVGYALLMLRFAEVLYEVLRGKRARLVGDEAEDALRHSVQVNEAAAPGDDPLAPVGRAPAEAADPHRHRPPGGQA
jgi:C4-dicarboxylate transporter DctQ subunit